LIEVKSHATRSLSVWIYPAEDIMHASRLLFAASLAAILLGCRTPGIAPNSTLPSSNPTATSTDLAEDD
jgi:hypothetical protein